MFSFYIGNYYISANSFFAFILIMKKNGWIVRFVLGIITMGAFLYFVLNNRNLKKRLSRLEKEVDQIKNPSDSTSPQQAPSIQSEAQDFLTVIRQLIREAKLVKAIENLVSYCNQKNISNFLDEAIQLQGRCTDFFEKTRKGVISEEMASITRNQLMDSTLQLANRIVA